MITPEYKIMLKKIQGKIHYVY